MSRVLLIVALLSAGGLFRGAADAAMLLSGSAAPGTPSGPVPTISPLTTTVGTALTCNPGTWTGSPTPTLGYVWNRNGTAISGATTSGYTIATADQGTALTCKVTGTNTAGSSSQTSAALNIPGVPTGGAAAISPTGSQPVATLLTCSTSGWTNSPTSYAYTFYRDGTTSIVTTSTYTTATADQGHSITCITTATNGVGTSAPSPASNAVTVPAAAATPALVQHLVDNSDANNATAPINGKVLPAFGSPVTAGNIEMISFTSCLNSSCASSAQTVGIASITHTMGAACTAVTNAYGLDPQPIFALQMYWCPITTSGVDAITMNFNSSTAQLHFPVYWASEWSGLSASPDDGVGASANGNSATVSVTTGAATQSGNELIMSLQRIDGATFSAFAPPLYSIGCDSSNAICTAYRISTAAGAQTNSVGVSAANYWAAIIGAMKHQ